MERDAVPARGLVARTRAASATDRPALRPVCEELTALAPGRVLPFAPGDSRKRGPKLSQEVKALASAAAERREASAPEARCGGNVAIAWRAPRPERVATVTPQCVARLLTMRLSALRLPFFIWRQLLQWRGKARARTRRENEIVRAVIASGAKQSGGGCTDSWIASSLRSSQ